MNDGENNDKKVTFDQTANKNYVSNPSNANFLNDKKNNKPISLRFSNKEPNNKSALSSTKFINQLKLFKLTPKPTNIETNKISNHNQVQKMRKISTASEKNADFKSKYGLNKTVNTGSLNRLDKNGKTSGKVVDEKVTVKLKNTYDSGPVLVSATVDKIKDRYKLPYGQGENKKTEEFAEQTWKHKNVKAYEEKTKRKIRREIEVPASVLVKNQQENLLNLDENNNDQNKKTNTQKTYIYGMNPHEFSGGVKNTDKGSKNFSVLHQSSQSPFKDNKIQPIMVDKAIQCELKKSKKNRTFSEMNLNDYLDLEEGNKLREFSGDKWYYEDEEFEPGELIPETSRYIDNIGRLHEINKWTKQINPSNLEHKVETKKKVNTEYKQGLSASFKVIKPDKNGYVSAYSNVQPLSNKNLGKNSAGQKVFNCNRTGEVIYSQVDKSKKKVLRDQLHTPLPGYLDDSDWEDPEDQRKYLKENDDFISNEKYKSSMKGGNYISSRSPSPVSRNRVICLKIPNEKQKSQYQRERSMSPSPIYNPYLQLRSSSSGPKIVKNKSYHFNYNNDAIEPPPQFATLGVRSETPNKLPPKGPNTSLQRNNSFNHPVVRKIPVESNSKYYYQNEKSNLSDQSSITGLDKKRETLEETLSIVSSNSEIDKNFEKNNKKLSDTKYNSIEKDYRKGMANSTFSSSNYNKETGYCATLSNLDKKKNNPLYSQSNERQAFTLDKQYLEDRKKEKYLISNQRTKNNVIDSNYKRPTQITSNALDRKISNNFSTLNLHNSYKHSENEMKEKLTSSLTRFNDSESDTSNISNLRAKSNLKGLNYPLKPVKRSASMYGGSMNILGPNYSSLVRKKPIIRSTESDNGYGYNGERMNRPVSRASTSRYSNGIIIQNEPIVLNLPAIDNSSKEMMARTFKTSNSNKTLGNKKLASSVNNISSVNRNNSFLTRLKSNSKKDVSKSSEKLNEVTAKLNVYQNSKTIANKTKAKEIKRSQSIPKNAKLPLLQKLKNKLKLKDT